jgi:hypothetical protein
MVPANVKLTTTERISPKAGRGRVARAFLSTKEGGYAQEHVYTPQLHKDDDRRRRVSYR